MNEFEKTPEATTPETPETEAPEITVPETSETEVPEAVTPDVPEAEAPGAAIPDVPEAEAPAAPPVQPLPNVSAQPPVQPLPNAVQPPPVQPVQSPYGWPPVQNPYAQPYGYAPYGYAPAPQKRRMPTGVRVLVICLSVLACVSLLGLVGVGVYEATRDTQSGGGIDNLPFSQATPVPDEGESTPDEGFTAPDIDVIPNTEGLTLNAQPKTGELSPSAVYEKLIPSTVLVITSNGSKSGTGTGIIATEDGYIITNSHVVINSKNVSVQVKTNDGTTHEAVVVGYDQTTDLAVLKIDGTGYTPAEFGDSDALVMGQWVLAIGNPGGEQFSGSLTRGIISGLKRSVGTYSQNGMTYIQTDAAINPGNSGGPLVNMYGQVVGISSAKIVSEQYEGMGFAIPITDAKSILDDLLSGGYVQGRVRFGITGSAINEMQASMYDVPLGFMIYEINDESSFNGTDVQQNDIITAINGEETPTMSALSNVLLGYAPGDTVTVSMFRPNTEGTGGTEFEVTVTLLEDKGETQG